MERLVEVFRRLRGVLRDDGSLWVNIASSYASEDHDSDVMELRPDLAPEEISYVLRELNKHVKGK